MSPLARCLTLPWKRFTLLLPLEKNLVPESGCWSGLMEEAFWKREFSPGVRTRSAFIWPQQATRLWEIHCMGWVGGPRTDPERAPVSWDIPSMR